MMNEARLNTTETAYKRIKDMILRLEILPGANVSEFTLSQELGISRTPVREALSRLESEGLITTENRRKKVYILTIREIEEIFDLKLAIEPYMAYLATIRIDDAGRQRLQELTARMQAFPIEEFTNLTHDHERIKDWLVVDREYHTTIYNGANNQRARTIIETMNVQWHRQFTGILAMEGRIEQNIKEHSAMTDAIISGNADKARRLMEEHLMNLRNTIVTLMNVFHYPASGGKGQR